VTVTVDRDPEVTTGSPLAAQLGADRLGVCHKAQPAEEAEEGQETSAPFPERTHCNEGGGGVEEVCRV
jgi:hypothetical protein